MKRCSLFLAAFVCCSSWYVFAATNEPRPNRPLKESNAAESLMADYAEEVSYARAWLERHNDVTRVVEILNMLKAADQGKVERTFQRVLRKVFPRSRRLADLEPDATRRLSRFFEYYNLQRKIELRVFSLDYPMAFNAGQIVGISTPLLEAWTENELVGIVAHEIGHIIAQTEERISGEVVSGTKAYQRSEEIKADWVAMMMIGSAGLDPQTVIHAMERIIPRSHYKRAGPLHPPMAVRLELMHQWLGMPQQRLRLRDALAGLKSPRATATGSPARTIGNENSWSIMSYGPMVAVLHEMAGGRPSQANPKFDLAYEVLKLAAKSANAAVAAVTARSSGLGADLMPFRNREHNYAFDRPRGWREEIVAADVLRKEKIQSGEMYVSPDSKAFLSSAYHRFDSGFGEWVSADDLTPESMIEKLINKVRGLPGVHDVRETRRAYDSSGGIERAEMGIEIDFRSTIADPPSQFVGRAVLLWDSRGILELIGLRQRLSPSDVVKKMDTSIDSVKLTAQ